jgi:glycosyltransferase involved in cell wall biosynthesis
MFLPLAPIIRGLGFELVYDSYEFHTLDISLRFPDWGRIQQWVNLSLKLAENILIHFVGCVLTIDSVEDQLARRYSQTCDTVVVLYNVPKVPIKSSKDTTVGNCIDSSHQLVYVGGISPQKGAVRAIKATSVLQATGYSVTLHFIGELQGGEMWFWDAIREADVADVVEHTPWLPYEIMLEKIKRADLALALHQPNRRFQRVSTGNGRKFFTYMQAGLPIVGPAFSEVGRAVTDTDCGHLVDTTDTDAVVDVVSTLLDSPDKRALMGARGRKAVEKQFNWGAEEQKLIEAYSQIANKDE